MGGLIYSRFCFIQAFLVLKENTPFLADFIYNHNQSKYLAFSRPYFHLSEICLLKTQVEITYNIS